MVRGAFVLNHGRVPLFCVNGFCERCNGKETKDQETKIVRWVVKIVRGRPLPHVYIRLLMAKEKSSGRRGKSIG